MTHGVALEAANGYGRQQGRGWRAWLPWGRKAIAPAAAQLESTAPLTHGTATKKELGSGGEGHVAVIRIEDANWQHQQNGGIAQGANGRSY